ncbi:MAG: hypothetical protein A2057_02545 [Ignavibacteria bacterium GWA2_35_9]|nr:MAG: hypothetical protein A2057_02545 [Ignavibacteria bacterium GWA2_35_9]
MKGTEMKRFQYIIILIIFLASISKAQSIESGIGVSLNTPAGNFSNVVGTGYGGAFMAKLGLPLIDVTGSVEYINFSEKDVANLKYSSYMWSINAGARISVFPFISAGAEIGNYWITVTADNGTVKGDNTENKVAFTPLIAAQIGMFEASLRYSLISDASFISIRAGIYF